MLLPGGLCVLWLLPQLGSLLRIQILAPLFVLPVLRSLQKLGSRSVRSRGLDDVLNRRQGRVLLLYALVAIVTRRGFLLVNSATPCLRNPGRLRAILALGLRRLSHINDIKLLAINVLHVA